MSEGYMSRWKAILLVTAMVGLMGYIVYASMARVGYQCEVCVEFNGGRQCRTGAGATEEEARTIAQTSACGTLAGGMAQSIMCSRAVPASAQCKAS
jgi:hypothetical protein